MKMVTETKPFDFCHYTSYNTRKTCLAAIVRKPAVFFEGEELVVFFGSANQGWDEHFHVHAYEAENELIEGTWHLINHPECHVPVILTPQGGD